MWSVLSLLVGAVIICQAAGESLIDYLEAGKNFKSLSKSLKLAKKHKELIKEAEGRTLILVLPTNKAWESKKNLYKKLEDDAELARELVMQCAVEVPEVMKTSKQLVKYAKENGNYLDTIAGTPIVIEKNKVYFGKMDDNGNVKKQGKPLDIEETPTKVLDDASIFGVDRILLPAGVDID